MLNISSNFGELFYGLTHHNKQPLPLSSGWLLVATGFSPPIFPFLPPLSSDCEREKYETRVTTET